MDLKTKQLYKYVIGILALECILIAVVFIAASPTPPFTEHKIQSTEDISTFMNSIGWEIDIKHVEKKATLIPDEFNDVFEDYNKLQLTQGCDLSKYKGKSVEIYTMPITNYSSTSNNVYATLIVHKKRVIAGDIHSADINGFMHTLR